MPSTAPVRERPTLSRVPRPTDATTVYEPALDGLRALAVIAVVGYHLDAPGLGGGLLGVGMFFTLSGFLITRILIREYRSHSRIDLRRFWWRRARRLLPALAVLLVAVLVVTALVEPDSLGSRAAETGWAAVYMSNWATIFSGVSYFERFGSPGPLDHLWSLAIEEQFYVLWPLALGWLLRRFRGNRTKVAGVCLALAAVSFALLALLADSGFDNTRPYEGTDTRAGGLLVGAALALVWFPGRRARQVSRGAWRALDGAGIVALAVIGALVVATDDFSLSLFTWGLLLLTLATTVVVAVAVHPASRWLRPLLSTRPLVWVGERSYGIYLWHLPVIAFTPAGFLSDLGLVRGALQIALTTGLATITWRYIEDPIRRDGLAALRPTPRIDPMGQPISPWRSTPALRQVSVVAAAVAALLVAPILGGDGETVVSAREAEAALERAGGRNIPTKFAATSSTTTAPPSTVAATDPAVSTAPATPETSGTPTTTATTTTVAPSGPRTRCSQVVHIGDSTSVGLMAPNVLVDPLDRIDARYREVGVAAAYTDISGARSIIETYKGQPNAKTSVTQALANGYDGCWVFAMGTNDTANQAVGSRIGATARIDQMMGPVGDDPVLWVTVRTRRDSGPYADAEMRKWNEALVAACQRYPNMRVYDWAAQVQDGWFLGDGIHFNTVGYRWRAALIARALAFGFPHSGKDVAGCVFTPD